MSGLCLTTSLHIDVVNLNEAHTMSIRIYSYIFN